METTEQTVKVRSICIDTLTAIMNDQFMEDQKKPGHDQWKDYGQGIYNFVSDLQDLGFECIMVLGEPGTGKSTSMRSLPHDTNVWFNADNKNPVWSGGKEEYGKKNNPRSRYHVIPRTYNEILDHIKKGLEAGAFEEERYAFLVGHTETYKVGNDTKERVKILGKLATKMQLEGKMESVFYSRVEMKNGSPNFILETQNNGFNTARSPMGMFEGKISNDYNAILQKLSNY